MSVTKIKLVSVSTLSLLLFACGKKDDAELPEETLTYTCPFSLSQKSFSYTSEGNDNDTKNKKDLTLLKVHKLTDANHRLLMQKSRSIQTNETVYSEKDYSVNGVFRFRSKHSVDLGMNNVPVLDQGPYGTCVTFATTSAVNAILNIGNFISQQCTLMLTKSLGSNYWNGAFDGDQILRPLKEYGIVSNEICPIEYPDPNATITLDEYLNLADKEYSVKNISTQYYFSMTLDKVRIALNKGHRILFGFAISSNTDSTAVAGFNSKINCEDKIGGLWACKQPGSTENFCEASSFGHEAIIIGYDDDQELIKIRNSWGPGIGDEGDFYMTYAFFKAMSIDGTEIY